MLQKPSGEQSTTVRHKTKESHTGETRKVCYTCLHRCSRCLAFHNETVRKPSPLLRRERHKWPLCLTIWFSAAAWQTSSSRAWHGGLRERKHPLDALWWPLTENLSSFKWQRNCRAEGKHQGEESIMGSKEGKTTFITGKTQTLHIPRTCLRSPRITSTAVICVLLYKVSTESLGPEAVSFVCFNSQISTKDHKATKIQKSTPQSKEQNKDPRLDQNKNRTINCLQRIQVTIIKTLKQEEKR